MLHEPTEPRSLKRSADPSDYTDKKKAKVGEGMDPVVKAAVKEQLKKARLENQQKEKRVGESGQGAEEVEERVARRPRLGEVPGVAEQGSQVPVAGGDIVIMEASPAKGVTVEQVSDDVVARRPKKKTASQLDHVFSKEGFEAFLEKHKKRDGNWYNQVPDLLAAIHAEMPRKLSLLEGELFLLFQTCSVSGFLKIMNCS